MIPDEAQCKKLWDKYQLSSQKRIHVKLVSKVAIGIVERIKNQDFRSKINIPLLRAAALLHDIDKAVEKLPGERHPDAGVRILKEEGMEEVAELIRSHPLHLILNPTTAPKTWEEKILFLADKMVKYEIIGVDQRFQLWNDEHMGREAQRELDESYPKVKELAQSILSFVGITEEELIHQLTS